MAPPSNRRPGYSRKAQFGTFFGYLAAAIGVLAGGGMLIASAGNSDSFSSLRGAAGDAVAPAGAVSAKVRSTGDGFVATLAGYLTS